MDPIAMFMQWEMYGDYHIKYTGWKKKSVQKLLNASVNCKKKLA